MWTNWWTRRQTNFWRRSIRSLCTRWLNRRTLSLQGVLFVTIKLSLKSRRGCILISGAPGWARMMKESLLGCMSRSKVRGRMASGKWQKMSRICYLRRWKKAGTCMKSKKPWLNRTMWLWPLSYYQVRKYCGRCTKRWKVRKRRWAETGEKPFTASSLTSWPWVLRKPSMRGRSSLKRRMGSAPSSQNCRKWWRGWLGMMFTRYAGAYISWCLSLKKSYPRINTWWLSWAWLRSIVMPVCRQSRNSSVRFVVSCTQEPNLWNL